MAAGSGYDNQQVKWTLLSAATGEVIRRVDVPAVETAPNGAAQGFAFQYPPYISDLRFTPDGSRLLTAHYDQLVRVWVPDAGPEVGRLTGTGYGSSLAVSADGRWVGVGQADKKITVWELASGRRLWS